jgi:hypothetical protein
MVGDRPQASLIRQGRQLSVSLAATPPLDRGTAMAALKRILQSLARH